MNIFKQPEELEFDMDLELTDTLKPICNYNESNKLYLICKCFNNSRISNSSSMTNKLFAGNKVFDYSHFQRVIQCSTS